MPSSKKSAVEVRMVSDLNLASLLIALIEQSVPKGKTVKLRVSQAGA